MLHSTDVYYPHSLDICCMLLKPCLDYLGLSKVLQKQHSADQLPLPFSLTFLLEEVDHYIIINIAHILHIAIFHLQLNKVTI